jgi:hypothetical protein
VLPRCDGGQDPLPQLGAGVGGELRERAMLGAARRERLEDRHRARGELAVGSEDRRRDAIARDPLKGEGGLERRRAATGDEDAIGVVLGHGTTVLGRR